MNFSRFLYSLISFVISLFFILVGLVAIIFPFSSSLKEMLLAFLQDESLTVAVFGMAFLLIGTAGVFQIIASSKKRTITIGSSSHPVELSETVVSDYLKHYWETLFPEDEVPCQITIKKNKILVSADLPFCPQQEQKELLKKMDKDLSGMMQDFLGLTKTLVLTVSFAKSKT